MKQTLYVLLIFTLMVGTITALYKLASPLVDFEQLEDLDLLRSGGFYISIDGGTHWNKAEVSGGKFSDLFVNDLETYKKDGSLVLLLGGLNGVYRSEDNGLRWERVFSDLVKREVFDIAVDSSQMPAILYLATETTQGKGAIMKSVDGGASFDTLFTVGGRNEKVIAVSVSPGSRNTVVALTTKGNFLKSNDAGKSWNSNEITPASFKKLAVDPRDTRTLYAITDEAGLFRSVNGGVNWNNTGVQLGRFAGARVIHDISVSRVLGSNAYLATDFGLLRSQDRAASFQEVPFLIPVRTVPVTAVSTDPRSSSTLYAGARNQFYKSTDSASTWRVTTIDTSGTLNFIAANPENSDILYVGIEDF